MARQWKVRLNYVGRCYERVTIAGMDQYNKRHAHTRMSEHPRGGKCFFRQVGRVA